MFGASDSKGQADQELFARPSSLDEFTHDPSGSLTYGRHLGRGNGGQYKDHCTDVHSLVDLSTQVIGSDVSNKGMYTP